MGPKQQVVFLKFSKKKKKKTFLCIGRHHQQSGVIFKTKLKTLLMNVAAFQSKQKHLLRGKLGSKPSEQQISGELMPGSSRDILSPWRLGPDWEQGFSITMLIYIYIYSITNYNWTYKFIFFPFGCRCNFLLCFQRVYVSATSHDVHSADEVQFFVGIMNLLREAAKLLQPNRFCSSSQTLLWLFRSSWVLLLHHNSTFWQTCGGFGRRFSMQWSNNDKIKSMHAKCSGVGEF